VTTIYPILYLDIDGVLLRRCHAGMFDAFEIAPGSNGQQIYFNAGGSHPAAALVGRTAHAAPSAMPVLGSMIHDGAYLI